jgi:acetyl-CoA decarbonylase/synthase complex subunit delta
MGFEMVKESYTGSTKEVTLGQGDGALKVGGDKCLPFYQFEGEMPIKPKIAMEIWDMEPPEWPESARAPFKDCLNDPAAWAKKNVEEYGADMVVVQLKSTDPNDKDASADDAVATVKKVLGAVKVPVIVWGTANVDKDAVVLKKVAEECDGSNLAIGPIEDANHKAIGAAVMGYGHTAIASSPIDINLAKQVNILLENLGLPLDRIIVDPTTGGLGYGLEYSYSVLERIKLAALTFGDDKLQLPVINNLANEVWKCKEAKQPLEEEQRLGDPEKRGIIMEVVGAVSYLMAGSNILIMRHPEAVRIIKSFIDLLSDGGSADQVAAISKLLPDVDIDFAAMSPELDLTIQEDTKGAPKAAAKPEEKKAESEAAKPEPAKEAATPEPTKEAVTPEPASAEQAKAAPVAEAVKAAPTIGAEELKSMVRETVKEVIDELKVKEKEEEKKVADEKKEKKETAEDKAKKERQEMEKKWAAERAQREEEEARVREERRNEREKHMAERAAAQERTRKMTAAAEQRSSLDKWLDRVEHFHRRKW